MQLDQKGGQISGSCKKVCPPSELLQVRLQHKDVLPLRAYSCALPTSPIGDFSLRWQHRERLTTAHKKGVGLGKLNMRLFRAAILGSRIGSPLTDLRYVHRCAIWYSLIGEAIWKRRGSQPRAMESGGSPEGCTFASLAIGSERSTGRGVTGALRAFRNRGAAARACFGIDARILAALLTAVLMVWRACVQRSLFTSFGDATLVRGVGGGGAFRHSPTAWAALCLLKAAIPASGRLRLSARSSVCLRRRSACPIAAVRAAVTASPAVPGGAPTWEKAA